MLATETIAALLTGDPQPAAARLVEEALNQQHPYQDNVTAVILACDEDAACRRCNDYSAAPRCCCWLDL